MKNKTNECHNKCYTGCHGDDISDQEGGRFYPETGQKTPAKISPLKEAQIFLYWYNDHKTIFAHNRGDMHCIKSHSIHFQVSPSTSEIFNKNLKIERFYPGLPQILWEI